MLKKLKKRRLWNNDERSALKCETTYLVLSTDRQTDSPTPFPTGASGIHGENKNNVYNS